MEPGTEIPPWSEAAKAAVVSVGGDYGKGRGFVLRTRDENLIITAAHCLPDLPPAHAGSYVHERTYRIVGPLGGEPSTYTECLFVNPVADLAILGRPDGQLLCQVIDDADEEWDNFIEQTGSLTAHILERSPLHRFERVDTLEHATALAIQAWKDRPRTRAWVLSLDDEWNPCVIEHSPNACWFQYKEVKSGIHGGMSGSPVLTDEGTVMGFVSLGSNGSSPLLWRNLPHWLAERLISQPNGGEKQ